MGLIIFLCCLLLVQTANISIETRHPSDCATVGIYDLYSRWYGAAGRTEHVLTGQLRFRRIPVFHPSLDDLNQL